MRRPLWIPILLVALLVACPGGADAAQSGSAPDAPEFAGITHWINSPPLSVRSLRGKVVLVDFWAFTCINCLHTLPHLEALYARYKDKGLVVIGVHTPELDVERDRSGLVAAVRHLGIHYPVAQDNNNDTWNAWHNQYWPTEYLVSPQGKVVFQHVGEGQYKATENAVRAQLGLPPLSAMALSGRR